MAKEETAMSRNVTMCRSCRISPVPAVAGARDRKAGWLFCCAVVLLICLTALKSGFAAEGEFELHPKWVRPGPDTTVRVKLSDKIDVSRQMFLRLTLPKSSITDIPLAGEQLRRRVAEVKVPGPLRRGVYKTELVSEEGVVLASGPNDFKVAATEKPVITGIMPMMIYPQDGRYNFEIIGENFNHIEEEKITIRVNDGVLDVLKKCASDTAGGLPAKPDKSNLPCLVSDWRAIRVYGLSLDNLEIGRPLKISVEVDKLVSEAKPIGLSLVPRFTPIAIALGVLAAVVAIIYFLFLRKMASRLPKKAPYPLLACLIIDTQTKTYSLSKFQMIVWAAAAIVAYSFLAASQFLVQWKLGIPNVPEGLPMLLGISATTTALAVGATEFRGSKGAGPVHPGMADFITTGGVFAPERLQFFIWTILGSITFVVATLAQDPGTATEMANIPNTFNQLMGASSLGYLAGKFSRKPGPVIKFVAVDALSGEIRIVGENLSSRAQVKFNGTHQNLDFCQEEGVELVPELRVKPGSGLHVMHVMIKNPDGQIAEWQETATPHNPVPQTDESRPVAADKPQTIG